MKKLLIGISFLIAISCLPTITSAQEHQWGSWSTDPCFSGVQFRARYDYYNEIAKKHRWSIQYKNNYTRDIAFSYNLGSSREGILKDVREKRGMYRTRIKPGQIDSGMWVFTDSQGQILETMGHARLLGSDEADYKGPFMTCDTVGNRGQVDTICRNEPNPYIGCQNRPSPPPAAMTFPNKPWRNPASGKTTAASPPPASPSDCLDLYKYFSENKKSDDPLAVKQSIDAANAFKARCKLSPEQQSSLNDSITSAGNHLERVQSISLSTTNGINGGDLVTTIDAVKKGPKTDEIYAQIIENLRANLLYYSGPLKAENGRLILNEGSMICSGAFEKLEFSNYTGSMTPHIAIDNIACPGGYNGDTRAVVRYNSGPNDLHIRQLNDLVASLKNSPTNASEDEAIDTSTLTKPQPVPEAEYAKKVVAEAKAKGIKIEPDSTDEKPKPRPVLTPRQRAAQDAEALKELSDLIQKDADERAAEKVEEERREAIDRQRREVLQRQIDDERIRADAKRILEEAERSRAAAFERMWQSKKTTLNQRLKDGTAFNYAGFPGSVWTWDDKLKEFTCSGPGKIRVSLILGLVRVTKVDGTLEFPKASSFNEFVASELKNEEAWSLKKADRTVQGLLFDGRRKGFLITKTGNWLGKYIEKNYYFEGQEGLVYKIEISGYDEAKKWVQKSADDLAKSFQID